MTDNEPEIERTVAPAVEVEVPAAEPAPEPEPAPAPAPAPAAVEVKKEPGIIDELYDHFFSKSWEMWVGACILAFMSAVLFLIASPWGSSGGLANIGANFLSWVGMELSASAPNGVTAIKDHRYAMLSITMLAGAMGAALMSKEFAIRVAPVGELFKGLSGGLLMGVGASLALGCTIGGFFSGWPALSAAALIFLPALVIGTFMGVRYLLWEMEAHPGMSSGRSATALAAATKRTSYQPLAGIIVLGIGASFALMYDVATEWVLIGFILAGIMIGFVLQRSRFCIVRALREPFLGGDSKPSVAIMAGIMVALVAFVVIKYLGLGSETAMVASAYWVPALIGGIIFGFGMTIAGGCTVGATWRAGEGHVKLMLALVGIVVAMPLTAEYIKPGFMNGLPDSMKQELFLPHQIGYTASVLLLLLIIFVWYMIVKWNERTGKLTAY